jgi:23S rRNA (guanosine2251-2'-O)-methyltransferase
MLSEGMKPFKPRQNRPFIAPDARDPNGPDLLYGVHVVAEALRNKARKPLKLWVTKNGLDRLSEVIGESGIQPEMVMPSQLDKLVGSDAVHQGIVLEATPLVQPMLHEIPRKGIVVLLDQVTDPHNVGAIFRSCAAFNVTAVVTTSRHSAETTGVLFKAASGATELVPFVKVTNLARAMAELKQYGFRVVGLDSEAEAPIETEAGASPLALVMGAEGKGLRHLTRENCDAVVKLDLPGAIKSLNVSNAAALALYVVSRGHR